MAYCDQCGTEADLETCGGCGDEFCSLCIDAPAHGCEGADEDRSMSRLEQMKPPSRQERTGSFCPSCGSEIGPSDEFCRNCGAELDAPRRDDRHDHRDRRPRESEPRPQTQSQSGSSGNLIAGAILLAIGALISVTGIGLVIGVPLSILGFGVMFPRFAAGITVIAIVVGFALLLSL